MAIRLRTLRLPYTTGEYRKKQTGSSSSAYVPVGQGVTLDKVYFQDKTGVLGGVRLGIEFNVWIPTRCFGVETPERTAKLTINSKDYEINDIQEKFYRVGSTIKSMSQIEAHYVINLIEPNL